MADSPNSMVSPETMQQVANIIKNQATLRAPSFIAGYIETSVSKTTATGKNSIQVTVNMAKAPSSPTRSVQAARALEYGSGTRNTRKFQSAHQTSPTSTIRIEPTNGKKFLVFDWDKAESLGMKNPVHLKGVDHPGVFPYKGVGYMRVALESSRQQIVDLIGEDALNNLKLNIRAKFTRLGGHT